LLHIFKQTFKVKSSHRSKQQGKIKKAAANSQHSFCISPIRFTSSIFCHLEELGIDGLVGLSEHSDEVARLPHVVRSEEGIGCACLLATSRSANAVDIVLRVVGVVKVDDKFHIFNICKIMLQCGRKEKGSTQETCAIATTTTRSKTKKGKLVLS